MGAVPLILCSAHRHHVTDDDMLHAIRMVIATFTEGDDVTIFIGPARNGALLEVGVVESDQGPVVIHAMKARDKYLR